MTKDKGNKLIAEFMGYKLQDLGDGKSPYYNHNDKYIKPAAIIRLDKGEQMQWNTSWDWLKPVVEKIANTKGHEQSRESQAIRRILVGMKITEDIKNVWEICAEFIEWYNKQK